MLDANLGTIGVWLAFVASIAGIAVSVVGPGAPAGGSPAHPGTRRRRSARRPTGGCWRP